MKPTPKQFNIGFCISTSSVYEIIENSNEKGVPIDFDAVSNGISNIERNCLRGLRESGFTCVSDEGHDGNGDLLGSCMVSTDSPAWELIKYATDFDEPFSTGKGDIHKIVENVYKDVLLSVSVLVDVSVELIDLKEVKEYIDNN